MAYSTVTDVRKALTAGASADDTTTASEIEDLQMQDAITEADAQIDGALALLYAVPIVTPPALIKMISRDLAAYLITLTWLGNIELDDRHPVNLRYKRALSLLEQLQSGSMILPGVPTPDPDTTRNDPVVENPYDGVMFTRCDFDLIQFPNDCC